MRFYPDSDVGPPVETQRTTAPATTGSYKSPAFRQATLPMLRDEPVDVLLQHIQRHCTLADRGGVKIANVEALAQRLLRAVTQLPELLIPQAISERLSVDVGGVAQCLRGELHVGLERVRLHVGARLGQRHVEIVHPGVD